MERENEPTSSDGRGPDQLPQLTEQVKTVLNFNAPPKNTVEKMADGDYLLAGFKGLSRTEFRVLSAVLSEKGVLPHYDLLKNSIYFGDSKMTDTDMAYIREYLANEEERTRHHKDRNQDLYAEPINHRRVEDIIIKIAHFRKMHPFYEYVEATKWDQQTDYIDELFSRSIMLQAEFEKYRNFLRLAFKKFFVGLVKRMYEMGQDQFCLVFQGPQGTNKSRTMRTYAPFYAAYFEGSIDPTCKDHLAYHCEYALLHLSELDGITSRSESSALKNYINPSKITIRRPYGRHSQDFQSQVSFVATVNSSSFLKDPTGTRRFVINPIKMMNPDHAVNMQQVYAQAYSLYKSDFQNWLTPEEQKTQAEINSLFTEELAADVIIDRLELTNDQNTQNWLTIQDIIGIAFRSRIVFSIPKENDLRERLVQKIGASSFKYDGKSVTRYSVRFK